MTDDRTDEYQNWIAEDSDSMLTGMVNGKWLDAQEFPPLTYAVKGIIPEGFGLLVGPPKAGKSWLVADIGLAVASGGRALGRIPVTQRPVLYLALEDGHRRLQSRFRHINSAQPIPAGIHVIIRAQSHQVIPMIVEFLTLNAGTAPLVILDTLGRVKPPRRAGEDSYSLDYAIGSRLKETIDSERGASLIVVHHSRKAESDDFVDAVSGTQGIAGSADYVIVLARKRHSDEAILSVTGRDIPEDEYALRTDNGIWTLDGTDLIHASTTAKTRRETGKLGDRALEVLAIVNQNGTTRAADIAEKLSIDQAQARVYLNRLADADRIRKTGRGAYAPLVVIDPDQMTLDTSLEKPVTSVTSVTSIAKARGQRKTGANRKRNTTVTSAVTSAPEAGTRVTSKNKTKRNTHNGHNTDSKGDSPTEDNN